MMKSRLSTLAPAVLAGLLWFTTGSMAAQKVDVSALKSQAEGGDATAQFNLGTMYFSGQGVLQHYAEAAKWFRLAAAQGNEQAQHNLGTMQINEAQKRAADYSTKKSKAAQ